MLKPITVNSQSGADALIARLAAMQLRKELKIVRGSLHDTVVDVELRLKSTGELWALRGVNDNQGGLTLVRI